MANVLGKLVVLQISDDDGTTWYLLVCETESGFEGTTEVSSDQTKCDGGTTLKAPGAIDWNMNGAGVVKVSPDAGEASFAKLFGWWKGSDSLKVKHDAGSGAFTLVGDAYITSLSYTAPVNGNVSFSATFSGNGDITNTP